MEQEGAFGRVDELLDAGALVCIGEGGYHQMFGVVVVAEVSSVKLGDVTHIGEKKSSCAAGLGERQANMHSAMQNDLSMPRYKVE